MYYIGGNLIKRVRVNRRQRRIRRRVGKYCKNCKKLNAYYKSKNCFIINKKLYYKWEKKINKKFILY